MPSQKDFKRLVRRRMQKTGESYTSARSQLLKKSTSASPSPSEYAALAGMSDETVKAKTGCTWERWVKALDRVDAASWPHRDIARYVYDTYKISGWWAQTVTVGYERIRGLREIGQRREGTYEATKSKTFPVAVGKLYRAFRDTRLRSKWLDADPTIRKATKNKSVRMTWTDGTSVEAYFTGKGPAKSQVAIQHRKLSTKARVADAKAFWAERLTALGEMLKRSA